MGAAIGTILALVAIAAALIIAAAYPALDGHVIAVTTGTGIGIVALGTTLSTTALRRLSLPSDNDTWGYW